MDLVNLASNGHASPTEMSIGGIVMISVFVSLVFAVISGLSIYAVTRQAKRTGTAVNWNAGQPIAPGEPTRCLLLQGPNMQPGLAIDVGKDEIRVTDLNTNALIASARLAQVTVTPKVFVQTGRGEFKTPLMVVHVPGLQALTLSVPPFAPGAGFYKWYGKYMFRFSWNRSMPEERHGPFAAYSYTPPAFSYSVSVPDWLTLVEKFGLASYLERHDK
jgi:hypothetical protein